MTDWLEGLTPKDWLFDGAPIRGEVMLTKFANLDWSKASMDMGPSVAGNPGPYWHVPLKKTVIKGVVYADGDTIHRLYPKLLTTKWLPLVRHAIEEMMTYDKKAAIARVKTNAKLRKLGLKTIPARDSVVGKGR